MIKTIFFLIFITSLNCKAQNIECEFAPTADFTGTCESFYLNGNIRSQTDFLNGLRHGNHREYYIDGQIAASATYNKEAYIGKIYRFSPDSIVTFEMEMDSTESGKFIRYSKDGAHVLATGQFKNSYSDGKWKFFDESGELINTEKHNSDATRKEIYGDKNAENIFIPFEETIDKLFLEDLGLPIVVRPETIVDKPDLYAEFPNGANAMKEFIQNTVNYPESAINNNQTGKVYISFIVELDGSLTDVKILRGVYPDLDAEAIRIVNSMPNWNPAIYNDQKVRSKCYLPITFTL